MRSASELAKQRNRSKMFRSAALGALGALVLSAATQFVVHKATEDDSPWVPVTMAKPPEHVRLIVVRNDGEWKVAFFDGTDFHDAETGGPVRGAWYWMLVPKRP